MPAKRKPRNTRNTGIGSAVLSYLLENEHIDVSADEIADATGFERGQVISSVINLRKNYVIPSPIKGWYNFQGSRRNSASEIKFSVVKEVKSGTYLLSDETGKLYLARQLEV